METLPKELKEEARIFIEKLVEKAKSQKEEEPITKSKNTGFGSLKGKIQLSDDFDAPLNDFKDYM